MPEKSINNLCITEILSTNNILPNIKNNDGKAFLDPVYKSQIASIILANAKSELKDNKASEFHGTDYANIPESPNNIQLTEIFKNELSEILNEFDMQIRDGVSQAKAIEQLQSHILKNYNRYITTYKKTR